MLPSLLNKIHCAIGLLPTPLLRELSTYLAEANSAYNEALAHTILQSVNNPRLRRGVQEVLNAWRDDVSLNWTSREVAAAITSAAHAVQSSQRELTVDLVWTGPSTSNLPIRRTDQVLLQMIQDCNHDLTLISFAIYKVPDIVQALTLALDRGIHLRILAETPESGDGKITYGIQATFGQNILNRSEVLVWPKENRPVGADGRYGSLHVKGAIMDDHQLFISSANLTEYALSLNMELGVLIESEALVHQLKGQIESMIRERIIVHL